MHSMWPNNNNNKWSNNFDDRPHHHLVTRDPLCRQMDSSDFDPIKDMVPWARMSQPPERHFNRLSRFCMAHERVQQTGRQTDTQADHATPSCSNSPHLMQCMRCGLIITRTISTHVHKHAGEAKTLALKPDMAKILPSRLRPEGRGRGQCYKFAAKKWPLGQD